MTQEPLPSAESVQKQLDRILRSRTFRDVPPVKKLLKHVVEEKLSGHVHNLKLTLIAREKFDDRDDLVRTTATRLRGKLSAYYDQEGIADRIRIAMPVGHYVPLFTFKDGGSSPIYRAHTGEEALRASGEPKFILSIDGIIPNTVGELIFEKADEETIAECRLSYQRSLEDFAFALVYGSQLQARWPWQADEQPGKKQQLEPAQRLISTLPRDLYEREIFDADLKTEPFLETEENHDRIRAYVSTMGHCMQDAYFAGLCKDLIVREAATYFGIHDSLFHPAKDPSGYQFGKDYYRHRLLKEIPALMGMSGLNTLISFVPKYPHKKWAERVYDRYDDGARMEFVNEIVLTHLATMYQFEKNASRHGLWRMPYAIRAEVTKRASKTPAQRQLRNIVVRHALLFALRNVSSVDPKELIISVLTSLRDVHPFNVVREMLEEVSLLQLEPDASKEARARKLIREIRDAANPLSDQARDTYSLARSSVLKELSSVDLDEYKRRLLEFFPQLGMRLQHAMSFPQSKPETSGQETLQQESKYVTLTEVEEAIVSTQALYEYPGGRVSAIRLYGAADQCLAPQQIKVRYANSQFHTPPTLVVPGEERIRNQIERRDRGDIEFFDGPCVRLLKWVKPSFESFAREGRQYLELFLGPIGWYDVERTNGVLRQKLLRNERIDYEHWIGLSAIVDRGRIEESKLTNLVGAAVTIFTTDGQVGYQERGARQSVGARQLSSAIAENLHRYFDDTEPGNPLRALHPLPPNKKLSDGPHNEACPPPTGELHPAAAVTRGITEEASYKMVERIPEGGIKCTGLCFGLDALQPDLLWIVLVNLTAQEFTEKCRTEHGRDWKEGKIRFVPADFKDAETQRVLARPEWIAAGKASLVRAIELIDVLSYQRSVPVRNAFDIIRRHSSL